MPIGPPKITSHTHTFNLGDVARLAETLSEPLMGKPIPLVEQALLWAYISVAPGVAQYPAETRQPRAALLLHRISHQIVQSMIAVGNLSDGEVEAGIAAATRRQM